MTKHPSHRLAVIVPVLLLLSAGAPARLSAQDPGRFLRWTYGDTGALFKEIGPRLPLYAAGATLFVLPAMHQDRPLLHEIQEGYDGAWRTYLDVTNELGGPLAAIPLVGVFEASLFTGNTRFQDAAFTSLQAWVYSGMLSGALKMVFGRARPESGGDPGDFGFFSGNTSYPSGHTTAAFAIITPWVMYYPHVATYGLFALSGSTAIARIALDKHWPTDVLAGAALGYLTARWLVHRHMGIPSRSRTSFRPVLQPDQAGVELEIRF
jgi:hypothetical protein